MLWVVRYAAGRQSRWWFLVGDDCPNAGVEQVPALVDSFEVTFGDDCGLFGVGFDGTSVFSLVENGIHGVHLPVDYRFQSDLACFLIFGATQDIYEANEAFIVAGAPLAKGARRLPQYRGIIVRKTDDFACFRQGPRARPDKADVHC